MPSATWAHDFADDILAFHMRHHDALKGTFAPDVHGNLPRHPRSETVQLNPAPFRLPAAEALESSPYCTPQWTEFRECLREVAPPPLPDADAPPIAESPAEPLSRSASATASFPGYAVIKRLADLSQASDVDPAAVAATLREAERVLQAPTNTGPCLDHMHCNGPRAAKHTTAKERSSAGRMQAPSSSAFSVHHEDGAPSSQRRHHHQHRRHHYGHSDRSRTLSADCASTAARLGTASGCHTPSPWGWPAPAPVLSGSPAPPCPGAAAINLPAGHNAAHNAPFWDAGAIDPTMRWYEVYYSWMLYYWQLYAAQAQQQQRSKRERRQNRHGAHSGHAAFYAAGAGPIVSTGDEDADIGDAHVQRRSRPATRAHRGDVAKEDCSGAVGVSASTKVRPLGHSRLMSTRQPHASIYASGTPQALREKAEKGSGEAARLRAEMSRLETYAVLSSRLASEEREEEQLSTSRDRRMRRSAAASAASAAAAAPQLARHPVPAALRAQGGKWYGSRYDDNPTSQRGTVAPADTWQALSERQRNGTLSSMVRRRTSRASASY